MKNKYEFIKYLENILLGLENELIYVSSRYVNGDINKSDFEKSQSYISGQIKAIELTISIADNIL